MAEKNVVATTSTTTKKKQKKMEWIVKRKCVREKWKEANNEKEIEIERDAKTKFNWIALRAYFRLDDGINCGNCFICITNMIEKYFKYLILIRFAKDFDEVNARSATFCLIVSVWRAHYNRACRCNHCNHFITFSHFILGSIELFMTIWVWLLLFFCSSKLKFILRVIGF